MKVIKEQVYRAYGTSLETAVEESLRLMERSVHTEDAREGVASYLDKRPPQFRPLTR
jgi:enoyl-CoA hydratase/carnithine racemase